MCFTTAAWKKRWYPSKNALPLSPPPPTHQVKLQVLIFNIVWGARGGEIRQVKLYSRGVCAKAPNFKVPSLLSMFVDLNWLQTLKELAKVSIFEILDDLGIILTEKWVFKNVKYWFLIFETLIACEVFNPQIPWDSQFIHVRWDLTR